MKNKKAESEAIIEWFLTYGWAIIGAIIVLSFIYYFLFLVNAPIRACSAFCEKNNLTIYDVQNDSTICYCKNITIIPIAKINKEGKIEEP